MNLLVVFLDLEIALSGSEFLVSAAIKTRTHPFHQETAWCMLISECVWRILKFLAWLD
jgi:hypothetical protein